MSHEADHLSTELTSPSLDQWIATLMRGFKGSSPDPEVARSVDRLATALERLPWHRDISDRIWFLWLRTRRGALEDFADFDEMREYGEVETREDLEELWQAEYPEPVQWHRTTFVEVHGRLYALVGRRLRFDFDPRTGDFEGLDVRHEGALTLLRFLEEGVAAHAERLAAHPHEVELEIERSLPVRMRWGRIQRSEFWRLCPDAPRFDRELGEEALSRFRGLVQRAGPTSTLAEMTRDGFLRCCAVAYDATGECSFPAGATPLERYRAMADGRDDGLLSLPPDDAEAFAAWLRAGPRGGHPWEIARGGNSTHITLGVTGQPGQWTFYLEGASASRLLETTRMALALDAAGIPFQLGRADRMLRMLTGEDFIGLTPDDEPGGSEHAFPQEDHVYQCTRLVFLEDDAPRVAVKAQWYPATARSPRG